MKLTTSDSALKNKIFLGFWFILFAGTVLFVSWIFTLPANRSEHHIESLKQIELQVTKLVALHSEYLLSNDREDNLFNDTDRKFDIEINSLIVEIRDNIRKLKESGRIERKASVALDNFSKTLTDFGTAVNNVILITGERGSKDKGIVSQWLGISRNMLASSAYDTREVQEKMHQIALLESDYLIFRDLKKLQDIAIIAEDIRNSTTGENILISDIDSYIVLTGNLASIEKRLGQNQATGILPELEALTNHLPASYNALKSSIITLLSKQQIFWNIGRWLSILLVVAGFVAVFIKVFALIDPLKKLAVFASRLSEGELPEDNLQAGSHADMKTTAVSLKKHVESLSEKLKFTRALNNDIFNEKLVLTGQKDELGGELVKLQQKIIENNDRRARNEADNMIRRYMNEGIAKFADLLRTSSSDITMLGDAFIREIVRYLDAIQGGLFLCEDSGYGEPVLRLTSAFAYNRKKYLEQTINMGEGLVGSCAKEKQYMNITEIPKGYISITSGLGDTPPDNLLLVPVLHENEILGVIEIASLKNFKQYEIDFAQEAAYSLGSTLVATRNNQRTEELLGKSQQQALEMAEQEEEMRQNMEELKATQEESIRREEELSGFSNAVYKTMMVAEYNTEGKIIHVNDNFCHFMGRDANELTGKSHQDAFGGSLDTNAAFWNELQQKNHLIVTETIRLGKKNVEITEHFARVTNRNNDTVKYLNLASNGRIGNS